MHTDDIAERLLAEGAEALLEAAFRTGDYALARERLSQARVVAKDRATTAAIADRSGWLLHFEALDHGRGTSHVDEELALFQQSLDLWRDLDDLGGVAAALFGLGLAHQVLRRDWDTAMPYFWEALALGEHAEVITRSEIHRHVGFYYMIANPHPDEALTHLSTSLELRHQHPDKRWLPSGLQALGWAMLASERQSDALALMRDALDQAHVVGLSAKRVASIEESLRLAESGQVG